MASFDHHYSDTLSDASVSSGQETHPAPRPEFSEDEKNLITRMFKLVGERWSLIAGRIPGRNAAEIEKYWTSTYSKNR